MDRGVELLTHGWVGERGSQGGERGEWGVPRQEGDRGWSRTRAGWQRGAWVRCAARRPPAKKNTRGPSAGPPQAAKLCEMNEARREKAGWRQGACREGT